MIGELGEAHAMDQADKPNTIRCLVHAGPIGRALAHHDRSGRLIAGGQDNSKSAAAPGTVSWRLRQRRTLLNLWRST
jgi:hypothetical protein